ncbi:DNA/RNA helicase [Erysipelatoclostridium sp. An15]|uniref:UvrD-helicase domain-containing protein n=1 Tax=Erysipelatoclostridium sp. An15 TaxID=1965566 RepID=UPI000B36F0B6|nr:UvrD-helicase domain-containing protein [Erysipelatoclostridium sp. An15]OUQ07237.1 DNA/RNA helicase [Erysipelatoclostridium sp. An15]
MREVNKNSNYVFAKAEADKVDDQIIEVLRSGSSFRVEAGAGSGKTYSLNKVIDWIQKNKWLDYQRKKQNVICITYTNAAVDVIAGRLSKDTFILPSTIHSFAWNAIKQYQNYLIDIVTSDSDFLVSEDDFFKVTEVTYTLGHRYKENGIQYLYHDDVLKLFCHLLDNAKFRRIFADNYPLILIDEYQDSYKPIIDRFVDFFIAKKEGPQFGFFGDSWQTIYQSNNACGLIENENLEVVRKGSNFRSAPKIVQLLNDLRPDLPQTSAIDDFEGEIVVITCDDYSGPRRIERNFRDDLPAEELKKRLSNVCQRIKQTTSKDDTLKVLMITHKVLAIQQGYDQLLDVLADGLRDKEDPFLLFFMDIIEPVYRALDDSNMQLLFDTLSIRRFPILNKSEKIKWNEFKKKLALARTRRAIDVFELVRQSQLIPIPPKLIEWYYLYQNAPETMYVSNVSIQSFLELGYMQFKSAIDFLFPNAIFSTDHGVKGEEYDNVVFVISKGWNLYQFDTYAPMITGHSEVPKNKLSSYERNRNLFYVCCSRAKKRLVFFVSIPIDSTFKSFLNEVVGSENIYTYNQYLDLEIS